MRAAIVIILSALSVAAIVIFGIPQIRHSVLGTGGSTYPPTVQTHFLNSCEHGGGSVSSCRCALDWFQSNVSLTQFLADEDQVRHGIVPADIDEVRAACGVG